MIHGEFMMLKHIKNRVGYALVVLALAALACNVQFGGVVAPARTPSASVIFIAPANNTLIAEGATIQMAALITDNDGPGAAKVEFFLEDTLSLGVQTPKTGSAPQNFTAVQPWRAKGIQGHLVTARASRADGSVIGEARITIQVLAVSGVAAQVVAVAETVTPTGTPGLTTSATPTLQIAAPVPTNTRAPTVLGPAAVTAPAASASSSPNQPILRVIYKDGLNIRSGPGTTFSEIGKMKNNDTAIILGRNADSTWWAIQWNKVKGWVTSSQYYSQVTGDVSNLPLYQSQNTPIPPNQTTAPTPILVPTSTPHA